MSHGEHIFDIPQPFVNIHVDVSSPQRDVNLSVKVLEDMPFFKTCHHSKDLNFFFIILLIVLVQEFSIQAIIQPLEVTYDAEFVKNILSLLYVGNEFKSLNYRVRIFMLCSSNRSIPRVDNCGRNG